jgi:hypothetical protein
MIVNFNNDLVLTSQNPEAIMTFEESNVTRYVVPFYDSNACTQKLWINGIRDCNLVPTSQTFTAAFDSSEVNLEEFVIFNGILYAATSIPGNIYRFNGLTWEDVYPSTSEGEIRSLAVYNGVLYAGTATNCRVMSSVDGVNWTVSFDGGSLDTHVVSLCVYNGLLYAGLGMLGEIYEFNGTTWTQIGSVSGMPLSMKVFNGLLYIGTYNPSDLYTFDGTTIVNLSIATLTSHPVTHIGAMEIYKNNLYIGATDEATTTTYVFMFDGNVWTTVRIGSENYIHSMGLFDGNLVIGTQTSTNGTVIKYDGTTWTEIYTAGGSAIYGLLAYRDKLYIGTNGVKIIVATTSSNTSVGVKITPSSKSAAFHIFTNSIEDFQTTLKFKIYDANFVDVLDTYSIDIINRPFIIDSSKMSTYDSDNQIIDNQNSFMLLRSNPKFAGNIKLVVDSSNNLFLDTFKVSDILSNKKYRKQQVSANSGFSSDIRTVFSSLPLGEMYKVDKDDVLNVSIPKSELDKQYSTTYNYGARMLDDDLYDEEYSILAPLWIDAKLPDYFCVFRINGSYNDESYGATGSIFDNFASKYISTSSLSKSWSLKSNADLGVYLKNHIDEFKNVKAPVQLSLDEYIENTWYGIAIDKGIVTGRSETPYLFNKTFGNFTDTNAFVSGGFERNNLLCANLINLEYAFNDKDVSTYSMHRYFGLYLTENPLYSISHYNETPTSDIQILSLDGKNSSIFLNSMIFNQSTGDISEDFSNRIFILNDGKNLSRITNKSQILSNEITNRSDTNIFSAVVKKEKNNGFVSLTLENKLQKGEHLRVINITKNIIWEVYSIDSSLIHAGESWPYASTYSPNGLEIVYRTCFSSLGSISEQVIAISKAFTLFQDYDVDCQFSVGMIKNDGFSIITDNSGDQFLFQRITSQTQSTPTSNFNNVYAYTDIKLFGVYSPLETDYATVPIDNTYGPINFELFGDRKTLYVEFLKLNNNIYSFNSIFKSKTEPFMFYQDSSDGMNKLVNKIQFTIADTVHESMYVENPFSTVDEIIINTVTDIKTIKNIWHAFNVLPISISLMSINKVKDLDVTVNTSAFKSDYWYKRENDASTNVMMIKDATSTIISNRNSYVFNTGAGIMRSVDNPSEQIPFGPTTKFNTFNGPVMINGMNVSISYDSFDSSLNLTSYNTSSVEESFLNYYEDASMMSLKYSLTVPYVTKWVGLGTDCRNNEMQLTIDGSLFAPNSSTNFIPVKGGKFSNEISLPSFKYLSPGDRSWEDYVYYDLNDIIVDENIRYRIKDFMFDRPYVDVFSKIIYTNDSIDKTKTKNTNLYFNSFRNSVDTIFSGVSLSFTVSSKFNNLIDITKYNNYRFAMISTTCRNYSNNKPIEVIINENKQTVLMIWYQGSDSLNFSNRNSTKMKGKNMLFGNETSKSFRWLNNLNNDASVNTFAKTSFFIHTDVQLPSVINVFNKTFDPSTVTPFSQFSFNDNLGIGSIITTFGTNSVVNTVFNNLSLSYDTFPGYTQYGSFYDVTTFNNSTVNYSYMHSTNLNNYKNKTTNFENFQDILQRNDVFYSILRGDVVYDNFTLNQTPMSVDINAPKQYMDISTGIYTYNGWYKPKFNNILNFSSNEDMTLVNILKKDFMFGNTNLKSFNYIDQLVFNKVVPIGETSPGNGLIVGTDFNVFNSLWDANYYSENVGNIRIYTDGYKSSKELPSFFGSKLISIPNSIKLTNWNSLYTSSLYENSQIVLKFNLSKSIQDIFLNNDEFVSNWNGLNNNNNYILNYVNDTILNYYNLTLSKISINMFNKVDAVKIFNLTYDDSMSIMSEQNFKSELVYENNEYTYIVTFNNVYSNTQSYYANILITRK